MNIWRLKAADSEGRCEINSTTALIVLFRHVHITYEQQSISSMTYETVCLLNVPELWPASS